MLVDAIPYGVVKISGRSVGEVTGQKAFKLAPGNYVVEAQHTRRTQQFPITVRPNETVTVKFRPTEPAP